MLIAAIVNVVSICRCFLPLQLVTVVGLPSPLLLSSPFQIIVFIVGKSSTLSSLPWSGPLLSPSFYFEELSRVSTSLRLWETIYI